MNNELIYVVIVGSEAKYWSLHKVPLVKTKIGQIAYNYEVMYGDYVRFVSGACPRGGVDIYAREVLSGSKTSDGEDMFIEYKPQVEQWNDLRLPSGKMARGYRYRNLQMASITNWVYDIEPEWEVWMTEERKIPYKGFRPNQWHKYYRRSGGTWTMNEAKKLGKRTEVIII